MNRWLIVLGVSLWATTAAWAQTHPLVGTWERVDDRGRLEVMNLQEDGRGIKNKHREDGSIRRVEIYRWTAADQGSEGSGTIKVTAEYRPDDAGELVDQGEGLEIPVTYSVSADGNELTLVLGGFVTEVWTKSDRSVVDPERATAVTPSSWAQVKGSAKK